MKYYIFCEIAWMKYYDGIKDDDKPKNGGKYIDKNGEGMEVFNFAPYNHKCYGYVMHYGDEMHIERFDEKLKNSPQIDNVTVIWVATNGNKCRIVGWYENAVMFRYWQIFWVGGTEYDYNFLAKEQDCYLIDEDKRTFIIPRASKAGKGKGMGQSQIWYADSAYAQTEFIPKVQKYLDSIKAECKPFYPLTEEIMTKAKDKGQSTDELIKAAETSDFLTGLSYLNLAVDKDDCYDTRLARGRHFAFNFYLDEAAEDLKTALQFNEGLEALSDLMNVECDLHNDFLAIEIGEKIRLHKNGFDNWANDAYLLTALYWDMGEYSKAKALIAECEAEDNPEIHREWINNFKEN